MIILKSAKNLKVFDSAVFISRGLAAGPGIDLSIAFNWYKGPCRPRASINIFNLVTESSLPNKLRRLNNTSKAKSDETSIARSKKPRKLLEIEFDEFDE